MTPYQDFLKQVIAHGIEAAEEDYANDAPKREGAGAGFMACLGRAPREIKELMDTAAVRVREGLRTAHDDKNDKTLADYWRARCFELEVGWVANVVSAALLNMGRPVIVNPTARGMMAAARILGVKGQ